MNLQLGQHLQQFIARGIFPGFKRSIGELGRVIPTVFILLPPGVLYSPKPSSSIDIDVVGLTRFEANLCMIIEDGSAIVSFPLIMDDWELACMSSDIVQGLCQQWKPVAVILCSENQENLLISIQTPYGVWMSKNPIHKISGMCPFLSEKMAPLKNVPFIPVNEGERLLFLFDW